MKRRQKKNPQEMDNFRTTDIWITSRHSYHYAIMDIYIVYII